MTKTKVLAIVALCAAYLHARRRILARAERTGQRIGPRWLGLLAWRFFSLYSKLLGVHFASEGGEGLKMIDPARRYIILWHPHGFLTWSAMAIASRMAVIGHPHGQEWFAMVAPVLFRFPVVSEVLMLVNARSVGKDVVDNLLSKGKSIAIQPGGIREMIRTRHDQEQAIFPANLGFIRMAIKHGIDLLPVYMFRENQMFQRVDGYEALSELVYRKTGLGVPFFTAKLGLPMCGLLPKATEVHVRWGEPVEVGPAEAQPSEERVQALFERYVAALQRIFERHARECLPPEVAAKGLKVVRLGSKPVALASRL